MRQVPPDLRLSLHVLGQYLVSLSPSSMTRVKTFRKPLDCERTLTLSKLFLRIMGGIQEALAHLLQPDTLSDNYRIERDA